MTNTGGVRERLGALLVRSAHDGAVSYQWVGALVGRAGRGKPYSADYIKAILSGALAPGEPFVAALNALMEGEPFEFEFTPTEVVTPDPSAFEMVMIVGPVLTCECGRRFIRNSPRRRSCYICSPLDGGAGDA